MDSQPMSTQHEQIALYGLFGDSTATLQGLNDHLSPSSLQQSPPCGSTQATNLSITSPLIISPVISGVTNRRRHHGVLLSDLADRSPSAGSVSASAICSHVSFDNLRCTYLVEGKGSRLCSRHTKELSTLNQAMSPKTTLSPVTSLAQTIKFLTPSSPSVSANVMQSSGPPHPLKAVRTVKVDVKSLTSSSTKNGVDVADRANRGVSGPPGLTQSVPQVTKASFGRKVGQQITVATRVPLTKVPVKGMGKVPLGQPSVLTQLLSSTMSKNSSTVTNSKQNHVGISTSTHTMLNGNADLSQYLSQTPRKAKDSVLVNVVKQSSPAVTSKFEPIIMKQKSQSKVTQQPLSQKISSISGNCIQTQSTVASKSLVVDESTLKTLVSVLNSQSDLPPQDQISLLRSLGITVVQAPITNNNITLLPTKNQPTPIGTSASERGQNPVQQVWSVPSASNAETIAVPPSLISVPMDQVYKEAVKRPVGKATTKRKQKQAGDEIGPAKKAKPVSTDPNEAKAAAMESNSRPKVSVVKCKKPKVPRCNKVQPRGLDAASSIVYIHPCPKPMLLKLPQNAPMALKQYVELLNAEILCGSDVYENGPVWSELDSESEVADGNSKMTKSKLLKKHLAKRRSTRSLKAASNRQNKNDVVPEFFKDAGVSSTLLHRLIGQSDTSLKKAHPEEILSDILRGQTADMEPHICFDGGDVPMLDEICDNVPCHSEGLKSTLNEKKLAYTLETRRLKRNYERLKKDVKRADTELSLLVTSFKQDRTVTTRLIETMMESALRSRIPKALDNVQKRCRLSAGGGPGCSLPALPYSLYCKQHIWHCKSQCLYKLDKNMKSIADIDPEPFVKKARKRTKLLPLIKRYKKKKRRKTSPGEGDGNAVNKENLRCVRQGVTKGIPTTLSSHGSVPLLFKEAYAKHKVGGVSVVGVSKTTQSEGVDVEETKPSDSSVEDLHLTGQEIMMSGVLDKLPEDLHDFDLFTTDKGAEELGRMLAATSPASELDGSDDCDSVQNSVDSASDASFPLTKTKSDHLPLTPKITPDIIVYSAANDQTGAPPSLESFSQSQCVHYTFGSTYVMSTDKKTTGSECTDSAKATTYSTEEDVAAPIISAEDLQDIEGVLESLQKDVTDVHSPKLPSSPAIDHYTSMLARQLSQEAETESLKKRLGTSHSSNPLDTSGTSAAVTAQGEEGKVTSLSRSFSLPASESSKVPKTILGQLHTEQKITTTCSATVSVASTNKSGRNLVASGHIQQLNSIPHVSEVKMTAASAENLLLKNMATKSRPVKSIGTDSSPTGRGRAKVNAKTISPSVLGQKKDSLTGTSSGNVPNESPRKVAKRNARKHTQTMLNIAGMGMLPKSPQTKSQPASNAVSSPILPLTLMQGGNQGGNVIKVIVPPGTVVNGPGTSGTQNMLLIPVNALVRSGVVAGNQNVPIATSTNFTNQALPGHSVKTQLSSLQAGQQFFIVNNNSASAQPHLTLVQKPNNLTNRQQALILNPVNSHAVVTKNLLDAQCPSSTGQKQSSVSNSKQALCNIKPNYSVVLNQSRKVSSASLSGGKQPMPTAATSGRSKCKVVNVPVTANAATSSAVTSVTEVQQNHSFGKFPAQHFSVRNIPKAKPQPQAKKPKAKFDPVTKKYVSNTVKPTLPPILAANTTNDRAMTASMLKEFTESTLSIQNKVQQINSVLSSLNSGRMNGGLMSHARQTDNRVLTKSRCVKTVNVAVASSVSPRITPGLNETPPKRARKKAACVTVGVPNSAAVTHSMTDLTNAIKITVGNKPAVQATGCPSTSSNQTTSSGQAGEVLLSTAVGDTPVCSGTVHWNQTTTAGPEIMSAMTLPLYVAGSLPVGAWSTDLAMNCPISGSALPVVFPTNKIRPGYQVSQRVLLRNIGSLGILSSKVSSQEQLITPSTLSINSQAGRTNVTTVVGTTMSPKLAQFAKVPSAADAAAAGGMRVFKQGSMDAPRIAPVAGCAKRVALNGQLNDTKKMTRLVVQNSHVMSATASVTNSINELSTAGVWRPLTKATVASGDSVNGASNSGLKDGLTAVDGHAKAATK